VAYNTLYARKRPRCRRLVTLGSPLGLRTVKLRIERPLQSPPVVEHWFNAFDERDVVALHPLDESNFDVAPPIENRSRVRNPTENHHGIEGYLGDPVVAARILELL
jgi:hypothetical protein